MARPQKTELDYFPDDCAIETEWELLSIKYTGIVYAIRSTLLKRIYGGKGYYIVWNEENALLHSGRFHIDYNILCSVVSEAVDKGIFDRDMYDRYGILTSSYIQNVYLLATQKRTNCTIAEEYRLVSAEETPVYDTESTQIKEKEIKENKTILKREGSKEKDTCTHTPTEKRYGKYSNVVLTDSELEELKTTYQDWEDKIEHLSEYMASSGKVYQSHFATINMWAKQDKQNDKCSAAPPQNESSFDVDEFFEAALKNSYGEDYKLLQGFT